MRGAAKGGMMEVRMGHMGLEHVSSAGVKSLSQRLVDDHTKGNNELMGLAKRKGVTLPGEDNALPKALSGKTGAAFDKEFAQIALKDHTDDFKEFEKEASSESDPDVKAWASKTLPTLQAHLNAAKALNH
jgi:putative membrane protein